MLMSVAAKQGPQRHQPTKIFSFPWLTPSFESRAVAHNIHASFVGRVQICQNVFHSGMYGNVTMPRFWFGLGHVSAPRISNIVP